jgi:hypothetical protein
MGQPRPADRGAMEMRGRAVSKLQHFGRVAVRLLALAVPLLVTASALFFACG